MAEHAVGLANAEWKPSLSLTGNVQYQDDGLNRLLNTDNQSYTFGLALRVPLFSQPAAAAQARRRAGADQAGRARPAAPQPMPRGSSSSRRGRRSKPPTRVVTTQQKALELARESVSIAQVSYENGVITSAELNDAQVRLLQTEWLLMQAKYSRIVAAARAKMAAGAN